MGKRRRLKSAQDVRRYLAHLINYTEAGEIEPQTAGRLAYISNILLKAIEGINFDESKIVEHIAIKAMTNFPPEPKSLEEWEAQYRKMRDGKKHDPNDPNASGE